jgi:hypothetical protein
MRVPVILATALLSAAPLLAHHSISAIYDSRRQATLEGTVFKFHLVQPHPFLLIDVKDGDGKSNRWRLEMDNLHELAAVGVTADTFKSGDRVVVTGYPARKEPYGLYVRRLDRSADGFWYEQVGQSPRIRQRAKD